MRIKGDARRCLVRDKSINVIEPNNHSEFEVQAFLWSELRRIGINARGEVSCAFSGKSKVRFDIAVFEDEKLIGIIETKTSTIRHNTTWEDTRQGIRYNQFDVPIRKVYGMNEAIVCLEDAVNGRLWTTPAHK